MVDSDDNRQTVPWRGIGMGAGAAIFYTLANVFLRKLSTEIDFVVVVFIKALTTASIFVPWLLLISGGVGKAIPRGWNFWILLFAAIQAQIFGNVGQQISFGIVGIAIGVPIYIGSLVASSALLGYLILKEAITVKVVCSLLVLIGAVVLLSGGGESACAEVKKQQTTWLVDVPIWIGIITALGTGIAFSILAVCIRVVLRSKISEVTPVAFVSFIGATGFGSATFLREGLGLFSNYPMTTWLMMFAAGFCNAVAFLMLSKSLKLLPVVYVNAINVSQVALAAGFGVMLFCEPMSFWLASGLVVMLVGFTMLGLTSQQAKG